MNVSLNQSLFVILKVSGLDLDILTILVYERKEKETNICYTSVLEFISFNPQGVQSDGYYR